MAEARTHADLLAAARALDSRGQLDAAAAAYRSALERFPHDADLHSEFAHLLSRTGFLDQANEHYRTVADLLPGADYSHSNYVTGLNYTLVPSPQEVFEAHLEWARRHEAQHLAEQKALTNDRNPDRPLRVGYVSAHFALHAVAKFIEPLVREHDRARFTVVCYSDRVKGDNATRRIQGLADEWVETCSIEHVDLAERIRADRIDILVDLAGHTTPHRLKVFARRPAPVQVTYIGYCNTTGMASMDWRITDAVCDPPGETEAFYTERLARLERGFSCFMAPPTAPPVASSPAAARGTVTFASMHKLLKLNDEVVQTWATLLKRVPTSRLLVYRHNLSQDDANRLGRRFEALGIAINRLTVVGGMSPGGHLDVYKDIDILLDAWPWSGHTTACEAMWMGCPVVTLLGPRPPGRMVASVLGQAGFDQWVARDVDQYLGIATDLASDLSELAELRVSLRPKLAQSPLCDAIAHTRAVEQEYRRMWRDWCQR